MTTRRSLLSRIGALGGAGAAFTAMQALGMWGEARAQGLPALPADLGRGKHVVVLGAGIAGLTAAYELEQAGFLVTLLEARGRVGGRAWTVRDGEKIEMLGEATQTARFSEGIYFNAGPARIPSIHQNLLGYAKKFGVEMEVEVNSSRSAYIMAEDGSKLRMRAAINDTRGHLAELLAKVINQGGLDETISAADRERLLPFLKSYGDLNEQYLFAGTERSGFSASPGAGRRFAAPAKPLPLSHLLANERLRNTLFEDNLYMQATMFQPVGGMDMIHRAFNRHLRRPAVRGAEVIRIRQSGAGVAVSYRDRASGTEDVVNGDYLVSTIPFNILSKINSNFSRPVADAIAAVVYDHSNKIAFESPRFWEAEQIYGGISFVGGPTALVWYPSNGLHSARGMLLACYSSGEPAAAFEKRPIAEQIGVARAVVERLHPGSGKDLADGIAVNWSKVPYSMGPWPNWKAGGSDGLQEGRIDGPVFQRLIEPDGRIFFAGAALSQTPGWQEGGIQSAHATVTAIADRVLAEALVERRRRATS